MVCLMMRVMMPRATLRSSSICVTTRIPDPFPDCPAVIAGVGNGIDTDGEPDKDGAFMDVFHSSGVFSLNLTFFMFSLLVLPSTLLTSAWTMTCSGESARTSRMRTRM